MSVEPAAQRGFTLLEVAIATLIVSVGLLGASQLQLLSLRATTGGLHRSQATALAHDIAERLRANPTAVAAGEFTDLSSTAICGKSVYPRCYADADCRPDQLARFDFYRSACAGAAALLPDGAMTVDCLADGLCSIGVSWGGADSTDGQRVELRIAP